MALGGYRVTRPTRKQAHAALLYQARKNYDDIAKAQGGEHCAICGTPPKNKRLNIDHDHNTMRVRGLLCHIHNRLL